MAVKLVETKKNENGERKKKNGMELTSLAGTSKFHRNQHRHGIQSNASHCQSVLHLITKP